jgi:hypothetical protein
VTLVDTSIWIGHFRHGDGRLRSLLEAGLVLGHAFVIGERACGRMADRPNVLRLLRELPQAAVAEPEEVLGFIERHDLAGAGIGYVDAHLLASAALTPGARLWSGDRRLAAVAGRLGLAMAAEGRRFRRGAVRRSGPLQARGCLLATAWLLFGSRGKYFHSISEVIINTI